MTYLPDKKFNSKLHQVPYPEKTEQLVSTSFPSKRDEGYIHQIYARRVNTRIQLIRAFREENTLINE